MRSTTQARQAALREALVSAAETQIAQDGLRQLKARALAKEVGCSVGAIYNVFEDMDALVMAVNARTFRRLGAFVTEAVTRNSAAAPNAQLITMAQAYLRFAVEHTNLWRALFDLEMSVEQTVPDWYLQELQAVFALIAAPLRQLFPDRDSASVELMVRGLFSAAHGIVLLGLERRISAVPYEQIETMLAQIIGEIGT